MGPEAEFLVTDLNDGNVLEVDVQSHPSSPDSYVDLALVGPDGSQVARSMIRGLQTLTATLPSAGPYALKVIDAPDLRHLLPYYECRDRLLYRVTAMRLRGSHAPTPVVPVVTAPETGRTVPLATLLPSCAPVMMAFETDGSLMVTTAPGARSYAVEWRATARATGTYQFQIDFDAIDGDGSLGVLSGTRIAWIATSDPSQRGSAPWSIVLDAELAQGESFIAVLTNLRADGHPSRLRVRRLTVRGPGVDAMVPEPPRTGIGRKWTAWRERLRASLSEQIAARLPAAVRTAVVDRSATLDRIERRLVATANSRDEFRNRAAELEPLSPHADFLRQQRPACLHLNACGDFQLMAREHWFELLAFGETQTYSMNVDGLFCYAAHYAGIKEHVFEEPLCIYLIEHETGSGYTPEGEQILRKRMDERGIPWVEWPVVATWASYMHWLNQPLVFSRANWGFGDHTLPERIIPATVASSSR